MKKVLSITLAHHVFQIEEDAYEILSRYLESVKAHFNALQEDHEIIEDIEAGIAEKLSTDAAIITQADVTRIITEMGTVEAMSQEAPEATSVKTASYKRLYRDVDNKVIAGVCAGIATYLGIDRLYVRLAFLVALLVWGFSIFVYIILWMVMPGAKTKAQKLAMQGEPVSLATLQSSAISPQEEPHLLNRVFALIGLLFEKTFSLLRKIIRIVLKVGRYLGGTALLIGSIIGLAIATLLVVILGLEIATPYLDPATAELFRDFGGYSKITFLGFGYATAVIPLVITLVLGISLLRRRNLFTPLMATAAVVVWIITAIGLGATVLKSIPVIEERTRIVEQQARQEQKEFTDLATATAVTLRGSFIVVIQPGETTTVQAQGTSQALEKLQVQSQNGRLVIDRVSNSKICLFVCPSKTITLIITTPNIETLELAGSTRAALSGFTSDTLSIYLGGSNRLTADVQVEQIDVEIDGSSQLELKGQAQRFNLEVNGSSRINAYELAVSEIAVEAAGSSIIQVAPTQTLRANLAGSNIVRYIGDDIVVQADTTPSSHVRRVEQDELDELNDDSFIEMPEIERLPSPPAAPVSQAQ